MKHAAIKAIGAFTLALTLSSTASAAMVQRLGGQAFYDTESDLTWLVNTMAAAGSIFDDGSTSTDGLLTWDSANKWAASLTVGGYTDWRLPTLHPINGVAFNTTLSRYDGDTDLGNNISRPGTVYAGSLASELAYLFYNSLGNVTRYDPLSGTIDFSVCNDGCLSNAGPFINLHQGNILWTDLEFASEPDDTVWVFHPYSGEQRRDQKLELGQALAVRSGDVANVPEPPMLLLLGAAFIGIVGRKYKR